MRVFRGDKGDLSIGSRCLGRRRRGRGFEELEI
jgi:hypothetical protein